MKHAFNKISPVLTVFLFIALSIIFALFAYGFHNLHCADETLNIPPYKSAFAADKSVKLASNAEFEYDGFVRTVEAKCTGFGENAEFLWTKDNAAVSSSRFLKLKTVSDSGTYTFTASEDGYSVSEKITVTVRPRALLLSWRTAPSRLAPEYSSEKPFTYNGKPYGVYPLPVNVISGDSVGFIAENNEATDAGSYTAKITSLTGKDSGNYVINNSFVLCRYTVKKAVVTAAVSDMKILYGDALPRFGDCPDKVSFSGFADGETAKNLTDLRFSSEDYAVGKSVGEYKLGISFISQNYSLKVRFGTLRVRPRPIFAEFKDSASVYGEKPQFTYSLSGGAEQVDAPKITVSVPSEHVGKYEILANCADANFAFSYKSATHEIIPRPVVFSVKCAPIFYGNSPEYEISLTEGSFAVGEDAESLKLEYAAVPRAVGVFPITVRSASSDYSASDFTAQVEVLPRPVEISVGGAIGIYGDPFVTPKFTVKSELPFGETADDLGFTVTKAHGRDVGTYALGGTCSNPCYEAKVSGATYTIYPRPLSVTISPLPSYSAPFLIEDGESLTFDIGISGFIGTDYEAFETVYTKLNDRGTAEKECPFISESGTYSLSVRFTNGSGNYIAEIPSELSKITVYPRIVATPSAEVRLQHGFTPEVKIDALTLDPSFFEKKYGQPTDFQTITKAFKITVTDSADGKMEIRIPVEKADRYYTAATEKPDGTLIYYPCTVENGYATFETNVSNTVFLLWQDKDPLPYALVCAVLALMLIIELAVLSKLISRYRSRKYTAYAFLPLACAANAGGGIWGGIYTLFILSAIEAAVCVILAAAIAIMFGKLNRLAKKQF